MFVLQDRTTKDDAKRVEFHYTEAHTPCASVDHPEYAGTISVWLRSLTGRDNRIIADTMMVNDRKGNTRMLTGAVVRERCVRAVVAVEGLALPSKNGGDPVPVEKLTADIYDQLPAWLSESIHVAVREMNGDFDEAEEELGE